MEAILTLLPPQSIHQISDPSGIAAARRAANNLAVLLGLDQTVAGRAALLVTEAATNIHKHAGAGAILLRALASGAAFGMEILAIDRGPGFTDLGLAMQDGMSTAGTYGVGLGAMRRQAHEFDLYADRQHGTAVRMAIWSDPTRHSRPEWEIGAVCVPMPGEFVCGDAWMAAGEDGNLTLMVADGLGHGPDAARASQAATELVQPGAPFAPDVLLRSAHDALRPTRGAAVAVACLDPQAEELRFAGIGNIAAALRGGGISRHLVSHSGIVGHNMRKVQEFAMPLAPDAMLIMHSDGLGSRWDLDRYPGLAQRHPALVAAVLYRDYVRGRDDVTVVAVQRNRGGTP
jgi:anti-sigma regulatory factor (Ser/Thr protein kinase)